MNSLLLSLRHVSSMVDKKINDTEIGAILDAFSENRDLRVRPESQSRTFKTLIAFVNMYVFGFLILYFLLNSNLLDAFDDNMLAEDFITVFNGRAQIMFWLLFLINVGAYFNFGFKLLSMIAFISLLNSTIDNIVLFFELVSFSDRPYFSVFIATRPLLVIAVAWMGLSYQEQIGDN